MLANGEKLELVRYMDGGLNLWRREDSGVLQKKLHGSGREGLVRGKSMRALAMAGRRSSRTGTMDRGDKENTRKETTIPTQRQCFWFLSTRTRRRPGVLRLGFLCFASLSSLNHMPHRIFFCLHDTSLILWTPS